MANYEIAATDLKARLDAKAKKAADLEAFFEGVRTGLFAEVEKANSALAYAGAPPIDFKAGWPSGPTVELDCAGAILNVRTLIEDPNAPNEATAPSISASITTESGEKLIAFMILTDETPLKAHRVSLSPATEQKIRPEQIAAVIVEELITGAP